MAQPIPVGPSPIARVKKRNPIPAKVEMKILNRRILLCRGMLFPKMLAESSRMRLLRLPPAQAGSRANMGTVVCEASLLQSREDHSPSRPPAVVVRLLRIH